MANLSGIDTGQLYPTHLGCERLFYITADPRNPTTDTLAQWELLEGRHGGLTTDEHRKIRRVKGCQQSVGSRESGVGSRGEEITTPRRCRPHTPHPTPHTPHPTPHTLQSTPQLLSHCNHQCITRKRSIPSRLLLFSLCSLPLLRKMRCWLSIRIPPCANPCLESASYPMPSSHPAPG